MKSMFLFLVAALAAASHAGTQPAPAPDLTVHEWGTFTSVQGSDGELIPWNPFFTADLPEFVYSRARPFRDKELNQRVALGMLLGKDASAWLQRMETPVLYFYSDQPRTVDVDVGFPSGRVTEWYPQTSAFGPAFAIEGALPKETRSFLRWNGVQVLPRDAIDAADLPREKQGSHYYAAREVGANPIKVRDPLEPGSGDAHTEKFLFYRGAGNFTTPLRAQFNRTGDLLLENTGAQPLNGVFFFQKEGATGRLHTVGDLPPGDFRSVALSSQLPFVPVATAIEQLKSHLHNALVTAGLFSDEAGAMIRTWEDAWFQDEGLRVLYLLPGAWTDDVLPLEITPAPARTVRVMVGRAELLPPAVETEVLDLVEQSKTLPYEQIAAALRRTVEPRFLEPALTRAANMLVQAERNRFILSCSLIDVEEKTKQAKRQIQGRINRLKSAVVQQQRELPLAGYAAADAPLVFE